MAYATGRVLAPALIGLLVFSHSANAEIIEANCTGMLEFDIYEIDTDVAKQEIYKIGESEVSIDEEFIRLAGDFGEYRFDLNAGTLYHNDSDTGVYCTYSTKQD